MKKILQASLVFALVASGTYWALAAGIGGPGISASPPVNASNITTGTLAIANGGTGATTLAGAGILVSGGALGTPSSGVISSCTSTSMVLTTPVLGTPTSGTLTNCTIPMSAVTGGTNHAVATYGASGLGTGIAPSTSGNVLTSNGTDWVSSAAAGGGMSPSTTSEVFDELMDSGCASAIGDKTGPWGLNASISGANATVTYVGIIDGTEAGVISCNNGTASTGYSYIIPRTTVVYNFGFGATTFEARVRLSALSDVTDTYTARIGFSNDQSGADPADGVFFRYTHGTNSGNWVLVARQNNTETTTNSSATPVGATWYRFTIVVNAAGTSAEFFINGVSVGTVASNVPQGTARKTSLSIGSTRSSGTSNSRAVSVDYIYAKEVFTTPR